MFNKKFAYLFLFGLIYQQNTVLTNDQFEDFEQSDFH
jgi:hypothetical protein